MFENKSKTNREWLNSLSDEELAIFLGSICTASCGGSCYNCPLFNVRGCGDLSTKEWLQAEHKEA